MRTYYDPNARDWAAEVDDYSVVYRPCDVTFLQPGQLFLFSGQEMKVSAWLSGRPSVTTDDGRVDVWCEPTSGGPAGWLYFGNPAARVLARTHQTTTT